MALIAIAAVLIDWQLGEPRRLHPLGPPPAASLVRYSARLGLIVLRSLGKFFGLAGARVGVVLAEATLLRGLAVARAESLPR